MCDECGGTGMWDVLSSVPCSCMSKKTNIAILIKQIMVFKKKAIEDNRLWDATELLAIERKLKNKLKNG